MFYSHHPEHVHIYVYIYQTHTRRHDDITESYVYDKHDMEIDENIH